MKILAIIFFIFIGFSGLAMAEESTGITSENTVEVLFSNYFGKHTFKVIENGIDVGGEKIYLAVRYIDRMNSPKPIFKNGIAVGIEGSRITPLLYFENNLILGRDRKIIVDLRPFHSKCYGWLFNVSRKRPNEIYHNGFSINVAWIYGGFLDTAQDPPISIVWDKKNKEFIDYVFNDD